MQFYFLIKLSQSINVNHIFPWKQNMLEPIRMQIKSFDFEYQNLFDLNYKLINKGPRLELNSKGVLAMVITHNSCDNLTGYAIDNNIELNKKYFLKINFQRDRIIYNINNNINEIKLQTNNYLYNLNYFCI